MWTIEVVTSTDFGHVVTVLRTVIMSQPRLTELILGTVLPASSRTPVYTMNRALSFLTAY
ncbi:hypothetical protein BDW60DRAFT_183065 [Aspergillus nidulans var. acristatus]|jgi:hypothetical protein